MSVLLGFKNRFGRNDNQDPRERFVGSPATRRRFSHRQTESVFLCLGRNLSVVKALTEDSNLPSLYRLPARAAFGRGPGGEPPLWEGQSEIPDPAFRSKLPPPGGITCFGCGEAGEGTFGLAGSPKAKGWEADSGPSLTSRPVSGNPKGSVPFWAGAWGQPVPRGKGCGRDARSFRAAWPRGKTHTKKPSAS